MRIILYRVNDTPNKIKKTLHNEIEFDPVYFKDENNLDIVNPSVVLNMTSEVSDIAKYNYACIPKFGRYYFITRVSTENALVRIDLHTDVLYTFRQDILNSTQYIIRSESVNNRYLVDHSLPIHSDISLEVKKFGDAVDDRNCVHVILETVGVGGVANGEN